MSVCLSIQAIQNTKVSQDTLAGQVNEVGQDIKVSQDTKARQVTEVGQHTNVSQDTKHAKLQK